MDTLEILTVLATWGQLWFLTWKVAKIDERLKAIELAIKFQGKKRDLV